MDSHQIWQATLGQLELKMTKPDYDTWVKDTKAISYEDGVLIISVHSGYAKDWLENRLYRDVQRIVSGVAHRTVSVRFVVQRQRVSAPVAPPLLDYADEAEPSAPVQVMDQAASGLNPKYTFDSFIIGQSNHLAYAGCQAVAENPGLSYNPLFIYGGVGLGKTHLMQAIGNHGLPKGLNVLYVSAETFTNELIESIRRRTTEEFRAKYRTIDLLLVDDIHFMTGKEATQEEFFHTFNDLHQSNRQIVLSSDRPPREFVGLEERLRSRFDWGLSVDIQSPDFETRMAILATKAESQHMRLPHEVMEFIAQEIQSNIRELEGALTRLSHLTRAMGYPLTVDTAQKAIGSTMRLSARVTIDDILRIVGDHFDLPLTDLLGKRRSRYIARPRQIVMYLAREMTDMSLPQIGEALGGRDHTTIMHGCDKIAALFEQDHEIQRHVMAIKRRLSGRAAQSTPVRVAKPKARRVRAKA